MKTIRSKQEGSVLVIAILMITILTMICAVTLQITTQNAGANMQTASWQQALTGAEAGVDAAMNALNTNTAAGWTGWSTFAGAPGFTQPGASPAPATAAPAAGSFNYLPEAPSRSLSLAGEGNNTVKMWVTVDTGGMNPDYGNQPYRIRATGTAYVPGPVRVSNQKMDNDLRNLSLRWDRATNPPTPITGVGSDKPRVSRRLEVIARSGARSIWGRGLLLKKSINMSGGGWIDSFDSSNPFKSSTINGLPGQYDVNKRQSNGDVASVDSTNSDLKNTYVWGDLDYKGPVIPNLGNVQGNIITPFYATIPPTSDPTWSAGSYTQYSSAPAGNTFTATGSNSNPNLIKITGDFALSGSTTFNIVNGNPPLQPGGTPPPAYITVWVTGQFNTSGSSKVAQANNVYVTWIVDQNITVSGSSYNNQSGRAANTSFIGVGTSNTVTDSGSGNFIGTINAPGYAVTVSGTGSFSGALIGNTINISGGASVHYDEALSGNANNQLAGTFSYVSWFEDTADPKRGVIY
jgi:Tfp pilus assembly protein PilX